MKNSRLLLGRAEYCGLPSKLYHGTSSRYLSKILDKGLVPRKSRRAIGNWKDVPSGKDRIYFSAGYAPYFAVAATKGKEQALILEIDTTKISNADGIWVADEDAIEQVSRKQYLQDSGEEFSQKIMVQRTLQAAGTALQFAATNQFTAVDSLNVLNTCAFIGKVKPAAITRYVLCDCSPLLFCWDASITIQAVNYMSQHYVSQTQQLFDTESELFKGIVKPHGKLINLAT